MKWNKINSIVFGVAIQGQPPMYVRGRLFSLQIYQRTNVIVILSSRGNAEPFVLCMSFTNSYWSISHTTMFQCYLVETTMFCYVLSGVRTQRFLLIYFISRLRSNTQSIWPRQHAVDNAQGGVSQSACFHAKRRLVIVDFVNGLCRPSIVRLRPPCRVSVRHSDGIVITISASVSTIGGVSGQH